MYPYWINNPFCVAAQLPSVMSTLSFAFEILKCPEFSFFKLHSSLKLPSGKWQHNYDKNQILYMALFEKLRISSSIELCILEY